ncbi:MAG: GumC family protein, partial [Desulfobulbaceae bacterium]|nr:GumC family protein [Desulfobulbaceae bacterium]
MEYDINLQTYWLLLKRHKTLILIIALSMGLGTTALAFFNRPEPIFESIATVKIEKSSTATGVYLEAISWSGADYLETQASIITSYPILEKVAVAMNRISADLSTTTIRTDPRYIAIIMELKNKVKAEREGNSNLINITAQDLSPRFAQQLASAMARVYTAEHTAEINKRTYDARRFIEEQLGHVADRLRKAEESLKEFEETNHAISLDSQTTTILGQLAQSEAEIVAIEKQRQEISEALTRLDSALLSPPSATPSFLFSEAPAVYTTLNTTMVTLLMQRQSLLLNYTAEHPEIQSIDSQLAEILRNLSASLKEQLATVDQRIAAASDTSTTIKQQLAELPGKSLMMERLKREVQLNENVYSLLENKLHEARIMEASKIEEVIVVKPALEPMAPINHTSVAVKGVAGLAIGVILGLLATILSEAMDTSLDSVDQIEKFTSLDVLATIGPLDRDDVMTTAQSLHQTPIPDTKNLLHIIHLPAHFLPG